MLSGGLLVATPHCVRAPRAPSALGLARNTLAVFMQPRWDAPMAPPPGCPPPAVPCWREGQTFGEFADATLATHY